jgi:hypothetical protein
MPEDIYKWVHKNINEITVFCVTEKNHSTCLKTDRWLQFSETVPSTQICHNFVPITLSEVQAHLLLPDKADGDTKVSVIGFK